MDRQGSGRSVAHYGIDAVVSAESIIHPFARSNFYRQQDILIRRQTVRRYVENGLSDGQIAMRLGVNPKTIMKDRQSMGIPPGDERGRRAAEASAKWRGVKGECAWDPCNDAAHTMGMCRKHYERKRLLDAGVKMRPRNDEVECSVTHCTALRRRTGGLCDTHYKRQAMEDLRILKLAKLRQEALKVDDILMPGSRLTISDMDKARCGGGDIPSEAFFPEDYTESHQARDICWKCPIRQRCLDVAIANDEWGIWGGTTRPERLALARGLVRDGRTQ